MRLIELLHIIEVQQEAEEQVNEKEEEAEAESEEQSRQWQLFERRPFDVPMAPRPSMSICRPQQPARQPGSSQLWLRCGWAVCGLRVLKIVKHSTGKLSTDLWPAMELAVVVLLLQSHIWLLVCA